MRGWDVEMLICVIDVGVVDMCAVDVCAVDVCM